MDIFNLEGFKERFLEEVLLNLGLDKWLSYLVKEKRVCEEDKLGSGSLYKVKNLAGVIE